MSIRREGPVTERLQQLLRTTLEESVGDAGLNHGRRNESVADAVREGAARELEWFRRNAFRWVECGEEGEHDQPQRHPNGKRPTKRRQRRGEEARTRDSYLTQFSPGAP